MLQIEVALKRIVVSLVKVIYQFKYDIHIVDHSIVMIP